MRNMLEKIWYINERNRLNASITFTAEMAYVSKQKLPFGQMLKIRNHLQEELFLQMYGHMPQTCRTIIKHLARCEKEARESGLRMTANRIGSSRALVESLLDQMTAPTQKIAPSLPREDEPDNYVELIQTLSDN